MLRAGKMKAQPVGSREWTDAERLQQIALMKEILEEFAWTQKENYEWLNEHMDLVYRKGQL